MSARTGQGLDAWIDVLTRDEGAADADLDIDYAIYAEGEALLGWLNATLRLAGAGLRRQRVPARPRGADRRPR